MAASELLHSLPRTLPDSPSAARARSHVSSQSGGTADAEPSAETLKDPARARPALIVLLALTAAAYLWDLSASGYANSFYAAAVQAGTNSWKALFFGSLDSSNFITVDKPPASLWVMAISGRIFGFSSASMLIPQALEGVAAVALLYATVRRWFGASAGLIAGALFAATPVAALMFRFNNPDALLVLLLVAAAYCLVRALERAGTRWIVAAGTMIGFAFLAKMMQAFLVLPAFALVYLVAAPTTLRRRIYGVLAGGAAMIVSAGWWVAIVALWPAGSRPMIDGSPDNSILNLIVGYNGLGRILASGSGPGGGGGGNFSGATGPLRLLDDLMGGQASWLLPAALIALAGGSWSRRGQPRTDRVRAALLLWGGWLLVTAAIFSFSQGVIHTYYTVALAPAIAALVAIGVVLSYRHRGALPVRLLAAATVAVSAVWAHALLARTPTWEPWLQPLVLAAGALGAGGLLLAPRAGRLARRVGTGAAVLAAIAATAGPLAYSAQTIATAHNGSIPSAGPAVTSGAGFPGFGAGAPRGLARAIGPVPGAGGPPGLPGGASAPSGAGRFGAPFSTARATGRSAAGGGPGGGGAISVSSALTSALRSDAGRYRWVAAVSGSQSAATLELASDEPVMAIGGFNNQGGNLTLAEFERYVKAGDIHYYISSGDGGGAGPGGGGGSSSTIASWVKAHYTARTIGGDTVYELAPAG